MTRFSDTREAKEFLVSRIATQAEFEGVPFSELERKELYLSESYWTLPDMMQINEEFDRSYNQYEDERKIASRVRNIRERNQKEDPDGAESWGRSGSNS
jgi:hypothetical protein